MATGLLVERNHDTHITTPKQLISSGGCDACLVHIYPTGPSMGRRNTLGDAAIFLGRSEDNDIRIQDNSVSRRHAKVMSAPDGYYIADLQSTNGTFVNDLPTTGPTLLTDGNYVRVGNCIYKFLTGGNIEADYHEEIYRLTIIDGLTEVHNRRFLMDFLDRELARSIRHDRPLAVLLFDIDKFKTINDSHGHLCGDYALRELSYRIRGTVRREDLFARCGGEEFCLVLVETPLSEAIDVAERIRATVAETPIVFESTNLPITVSVGVASTPGGQTGLTAAELMRLADEKMYAAKNSGRNRVQS